MKSLIFLALLGFLGSSCAIKLDIPSYVCSLMIDGMKIKSPENSCGPNYFLCVDGNPIPQTCQRNYYFNKDRQICVPKDELYCPKHNACGGQTRGFKPDPYSCEGFYICGGSALKPSEKLSSCQNDYSFYEDRCWPNSDRCDIEYCLIVPHYHYFGAHGDNCAGWQFCKGDKLETGSCDEGLIFDRAAGHCTYPTGTNCRGPKDHQDTKAGDYCEYKDFKIDPKSCSSYYYCHDKKVYKGDCLDGKFFNGTACVNRLSYHCNRGGNPCEGLSKSEYRQSHWVNDPEDCKRFYYCDNNKVGGQSRPCSEISSSTYFNQETQSCTKTRPKYAACYEP